MTMITTATIGTLATAFQHIALTKLVPSAANVRKVNSTAGIGELANSIEAHGLIQNLTVRKAGKGQKFEVVAGARRLAALRLLAKEGRVAKDIDIPCNVLAAERDAVVAPQRPDTSSLVERSAMNSRGERYPSALCG